jgi:hypothetical protein
VHRSREQRALSHRAFLGFCSVKWDGLYPFGGQVVDVNLPINASLTVE